ncbi:MAG: signal peptidase I [Alphaproteobacteria bacterium]|nr:signal peptidase I [Alphaproteobacteria bacterium]
MESEVPSSTWWTSPTFEAIKTVVYALLIALFIRTFLYQPFNIPSSSMEDTLLVGDYLFVSKFSYGYSNYSFPWSPNLFSGRAWAGQPERGDVVVFKYPARTTEDYIKRLVGLPGDRIQMIDGVLHINGVPCKMERVDDFIEVRDDGSEIRVPKYRETLPGGVSHYILDSKPDWPNADNTQEFVVPAKHYFMMGDNRDNSNDSRIPDSGVGFVPEENLVGRADVIFFSTNGKAQIWEIWNWPWAIRYSRFFNAVG